MGETLVIDNQVTMGERHLVVIDTLTIEHMFFFEMLKWIESIYIENEPFKMHYLVFVCMCMYTYQERFNLHVF